MPVAKRAPGRHAPGTQVQRALLGGGEVTLARLVDPEPVRLEIGRHGRLRHGELAFAAQGGDDLGRQEMRVDDQVARLVLEQPHERLQVELLDQQPQLVAAIAPRKTGPVEHVVEVTEDVRRLVDQVEIRLAVDAAEGGVGQGEHVEVPDNGLGADLAQGQLDRLGRPHVPRPDRRRQDRECVVP